jgi:hypothetical protein
MDMNWLAAEAKNLHQIFNNVFYLMVSTCLVIGIITEYFKIPLGGMPQFSQMIGRVLVAALLLVAVPEIMNMLASVTDAIVNDVGGLNKYSVVLQRMGEKLGGLSKSWVSFRDMIILLVSFLTFCFLHITVYLMDAFFVFAWMMLYIMSPLLVALFVLPATQSATKQLFKSLFEVCAWKCVWGVLCALLWSFALSDINKPEYHVDFLTAIILNLMLAFSVIMTPKVTSAFLGGGISQVADSFGSAMLTAAAWTPQGLSAKIAAHTIKKDSLPRKALRGARGAAFRPVKRAGKNMYSSIRQRFKSEPQKPEGV